MRHSILGIVVSASTVLGLAVIVTQSAQAQAYKVIYNFTAGAGGTYPTAGVTMGHDGNLYGTTLKGGNFGQGAVYKLTHKGSGWVFGPLYSFEGSGNNDGASPGANVVFGPNGALYGTTEGGGTGGDGTVFSLAPQPRACTTALCSWAETVLFRFQGTGDGSDPQGNVTFDQSGNIYGTTYTGGALGYGDVYTLVPSGGAWRETVLYSFKGYYGVGHDGAYPRGGVVFDSSGNLYGTAQQDGSQGCGIVYELIFKGGTWTEISLHDFQGGNDGCFPSAGLVFDAAGNLYGTTEDLGSGGGGTVFELTPSNGSWVYQVIYELPGSSYELGDGPEASLIVDGAGNLYGTTHGNGSGGADYGTAFKLTPSPGGWTETILHSFAGGSDGKFPYGSLLLDGNGNLYGTAQQGGTGSANYCAGCGVVFEITP